MSLRGSAARRQSGPRRVASRLLRVLLVVSLPGVLLIAPFRWLPPPTSAFIERARSERGASGIHYRWTPLSQISPHLALCVLTAEDQRFPEHRGFDLASIRAALREERARPRGASTLSQQLAKNLYLWPGRSLVRKGLEAYLTVFLELLWPKRRILEVYLNVAEFAPGTFGAGAASRRLFEKAPRALSLREAALLAAVLPSPSRLRAADPSAYLQRRASEIELEASRLRPRLEPLL